MFCTNCGKQLQDNSASCPYCGNNTISNSMPQQNDFKKSQYDVWNSKQNLENTFIDPNEQLLGKFGNDYFVNLLYNKTGKCHALLTDKRIYLKGTFYSESGKSILKTTEERTLDLEDVTGTGFIYGQLSIIMILFSLFSLIFALIIHCVDYNSNGAVLVVGLFIAIPIAIYALKSRKTLFFIDYAGGRIKIDASLIGLSDVQDFHKQMRRAKDALKKEK